MTLVVTKGDGSGTQTVKTLDDVVGTAGTANAGVLSIQGIASGTDVQVKLSAGTAIAGKFTTDQTTHGTTDLVAADITKVAGATISQGHGTAATAIRVELPTDGTGVVGLIAGSAAIGKVDASGQMAKSYAGNYEAVAASATDQAMGATGATGDFISHLVVVPASTSPGAISIKDGAGSSMTVFAGGASSVSSLAPFQIRLEMTSTAGAWKVTTGASISCIGVGSFT